MPVKKPHINQRGLHFITFTNYKRLPLIDIVQGYDLVYKWFNYLRSKGHDISGYVIMPNHLHVLINFGESTQSLNTIIGNGKRFLAYGIVQRLQQTGKADILKQLSAGVSDAERQRGKLHHVFEPSFDIKECISLPFINQKLQYMHQNPLSGKWTLAVDMISYIHSSARYYETAEQGIYPVTNFIEYIDKN